MAYQRPIYVTKADPFQCGCILVVVRDDLVRGVWLGDRHGAPSVLYSLCAVLLLDQRQASS